MKIRRIVFAGGPGTGKTATLTALKEEGCCCLEEVSRQVTREAQKKGVSQLFLEEPLLFSQKLLEGRIHQFVKASEIDEQLCFYDRGIPEVTAYMEYKNETIPNQFMKANQKHRYDQIFIFPIWKEIYISDNERYESLKEAEQIDKYIRNTYQKLGYNPIEVPKASVTSRVDFILNQIKHAFS